MNDAPLTPPIFDGHNDAVLLLQRAHGGDIAPFLDGTAGHVNLPKARAGGLAGGFFALYVPSPSDAVDSQSQMIADAYDLPLPDPLDRSAALDCVLDQLSILFRLERAGALRICRDAAAIRAAMAEGVLAAVLHIEGAEAIGPDLAALDTLHAAGLRSLGPVWSRPNPFGHGVPFRYPGNPDTGPGLTPDGERLVRRCDELGIVVDTSHMTEAAFWDVARVSDRTLVATHSNAHALCPHTRNLTDRQLDAIAERQGVVGLNFAAAFLRADGRMLPEVPLETMLRHLDHLLARLGERGVALGSDFDGAEVPAAIGSAAGLPALRAAMLDHGYGAELTARICNRNWIELIESTAPG